MTQFTTAQRPTTTLKTQPIPPLLEVTLLCLRQSSVGLQTSQPIISLSQKQAVHTGTKHGGLFCGYVGQLGHAVPC